MLEAHQQHQEAANNDFSGVRLIDDEHIQSSIGVSETDTTARNRDVMLLTNKRIIHISGAAANQHTSFASIDDVSVVEIIRHSEGYGSFIWAGLAFLVSVMLWQVIDSQALSLVAAVAVALMGVYLIVDRLIPRGEYDVVFRTRTTEIRTKLNNASALPDAKLFIATLFSLKDEQKGRAYSTVRTFALR